MVKKNIILTATAMFFTIGFFISSKLEAMLKNRPLNINSSIKGTYVKADIKTSIPEFESEPYPSVNLEIKIDVPLANIIDTISSDNIDDICFLSYLKKVFYKYFLLCFHYTF